MAPRRRGLLLRTEADRRHPAADTGVICLRWRSGALGTVSVGMLAYPKNFGGSITILGEHGTVPIRGVAVNEIQHWAFAVAHPDDEHVNSASYQTTSVYGLRPSALLRPVIKVLRSEAEPETDGREGLKSLEVMIAIYLSARDGRRVALPLDY